MGWTKLITDEAELAGMPESALAAQRKQAGERAGRFPVNAGYPELSAGDDLLRQPGAA
jgi:Zn-dependent oligopeptidase